MTEETIIFSLSYPTFEVVPLQQIGPVLIGMSREQSRVAMRKAPKPFQKGDSPNLTDAYDESGIHVFFDDEDRVEFIEAFNDERVIFTYKGTSVFETKAEELVELISKDAPYNEDPHELGCYYKFPALELGVWRPFVPEDDEDEYQCFATIGIGRKGYFSLP